MGMNPVAKAMWLTALRSGDYKQGKGALNKNGKFCCLGVLCEISTEVLELKINTLNEMSDCACPDCSSKTLYDGKGSYLPAIVAAWAGVDTMGAIPSKDGSGTFGNLTEMNDKGKTFEEIAQIIEERF